MLNRTRPVTTKANSGHKLQARFNFHDTSFGDDGTKMENNNNQTMLDGVRNPLQNPEADDDEINENMNDISGIAGHDISGIAGLDQSGLVD